MPEPVSLGYGPELPNPHTTEFNRFVVQSANGSAPEPFKKETIGAIKRWRSMTNGQLALSFFEYSSIDLVATFEQDLDKP